MKKYLFIVGIMLFCSVVCAQIKFQSGYFITTEGKKTLCLVRNNDWLNNPKEFSYKESENSDIKKATISEIVEFGILNSSKFRRYTLDIDTSAELIETLGKNKFPEFKKEQLFLKIIVEGKASLFVYRNKNLTRFFFSTDSLKIEQLIHKTYFASESSIEENNSFRIQLWNNLSCSTISERDIDEIKYDEKDLSRLFSAYNIC
jgi:hypothetical protein